MSDNSFPLRERTTLIFGPFSSLIQVLMQKLTDLGSDCVLLSGQAMQAKKYCDSLSESRTLQPKRGRAFTIELKCETDAQIVDSVRACAQLFNAIDLFVDCKTLDLEVLRSLDSKVLGSQRMNELFRQYFVQSYLISEQVIPFFKTRRRGRLVFLNRRDLPFWRANPDLQMVASIRQALQRQTQSMADELSAFQITVNSIELNVHEEDLRLIDPARPIKDHLEDLQKTSSETRLTDDDKLSSLIAMLLSPAGGLLNRQVFQT